MAKAAAVETGKVEETTIRKRILDETEQQSEAAGIEFWSYQEGLTVEEWSNHIIYLYRCDPATGRRGAYICKYTSPISLEGIRAAFGGGRFNIQMKKGAQLIKNQYEEIEGAAKFQSDPAAAVGAAAPAAGSETSTLAREIIQLMREELRASRGGDAAASAVQSAVDLNAKVFAVGAETLRSTLAAQVMPDGRENSLMNQFMQAAIARLVNPPNQLTEMLSMIAAVKNAGLLGTGGAIQTESMGAALVSRAPEIVRGLVDAAKEYRLAAEANASVELARSGVSPRPIIVAQPQPRAVPEPIHTNPSAASAQLTVEDVERKIIGMLNDGLSGEAAGIVLDEMAPKYLDMIKTYTVDGLLGALRSRPILAEGLKHPSIRKFVTDLLEYANHPEAPAEEVVPAKPN